MVVLKPETWPMGFGETPADVPQLKAIRLRAGTMALGATVERSGVTGRVRSLNSYLGKSGAVT